MVNVMVNDCGGHRKALELMLEVFPLIPADIGPEVQPFRCAQVANAVLTCHTQLVSGSTYLGLDERANAGAVGGESRV